MGNLEYATTLAAQHSVLSRRCLLGLGWTRGQIDDRLRRRQWRSLLAGVLLLDADLYADSWPELAFETRLAAAVAFHGPAACFAHETAAQILGIQGLWWGDGTIHLRLPPGNERHQQPGVRVHTLKFRPDETTSVDGWPVTTAGRTVTDLLLRERRFEAVSVLDSGLQLGLIDPAELDDLRLRTFRRRGAAISKNWWDLADWRSQSPLETRIRLIAEDCGYPPTDLQYPVRSAAGRVLGYGDLAWKRRGRRILIAEADGRGPHELPGALFRDRERANDFSSVGGIDMVRFTWADTNRNWYVEQVLRGHLG